MTPPHAPTMIYTAASVAAAGLIILVFHLVMARTAANRSIAGFVACVVGSPLMLVGHVCVAIGMAAVGLVCAISACVLAEDQGEDGRGGGGGSAPVDSDPDPGSDPDLWTEFERDFWSHVERTRELVPA
jgi:hypothetical protein